MLELSLICCSPLLLLPLTAVVVVMVAAPVSWYVYPISNSDISAFFFSLTSLRSLGGTQNPLNLTVANSYVPATLPPFEYNDEETTLSASLCEKSLTRYAKYLYSNPLTATFCASFSRSAGISSWQYVPYFFASLHRHDDSSSWL